MITVRIEAQVQWRSFRSASGEWIAICDPFGLTIESSTWAELMEDIAHALNAMFRDLLRSNKLNQFLQTRGWQPLGKINMRPADVRFDIPFTVTPRGPVTGDSAVPLH